MVNKKETALATIKECKAKLEESSKEALELMTLLESMMFMECENQKRRNVRRNLKRRIKRQQEGKPYAVDGDDLIF